MSTPESIVVSLEWAKKLKDAGWPQGNYAEDVRSHFYWYNTIDGLNNWKIISLEDIRGLISKFEIAAPTAEELLRRLPEYFDDAEMRDGIYKRFWLVAQKDGNWTVCYSDGHCQIKKGIGPMRITGDTLANAAASMWIFLKENNLLPKP